MTAKVTDEMFCRVLEFVKDGEDVGWNFCVIMGDKEMINSFAGLTEELK